MKVLGSLYGSLAAIPESVRALERQGFDAAYAVEIANDPFLPALLAAEHSERIGITTAIAVAFARNPMTLAQTAWDLNQYAQGRFVLGIGSQVQGHITRRFGMPWSQPAPRMREFVRAMQAIWRCWAEGAPLDFDGEFYRHTLMTPMFVPKEREHGAPRVRVAAVGPLMTTAAAEAADGLIAHGFTTERYLREVTLPAVERGLAQAGRAREDFEILAPIMVVTGDDEAAFVRNREATRAQIAFYASTPAYAGVLGMHGWEELGRDLTVLSRSNRWAEMAGRIDDAMLGTIAIVRERPEDVPQALRARYAGVLDGWLCTALLADPERQAALVRAVRGIGDGS